MRFMLPMNVRLPLCLVCAALLVGCGKSSDRDKPESADASIPGSTRTKRSERADAPASRHQELRAALAAALKLDASEARDQALAEVVRDAFEPAPDIAAEAFGQLAVESAERMKTIRYLAPLRARRNPDEALAWADSLGSPTEIAAAKDEIALVLAEVDPARAAKIMLESGIPKGGLDQTKVEVIRLWAGTAPKDAATWALRLPPGEARSVGVQTVVSIWLQADSAAAFSWLEASPNQVVRKEVTHAMAQALVAIPEPIRETFLGNADAAMRSELEQQVKQITEQADKETPPSPEFR